MYFEDDIIKSNWTEAAMISYFESQGIPCQKMDHRIFPYDLTIMSKGKALTIEVKALDWSRKGYDQAVIEIWHDDERTKRPQWIANNQSLDYVVFINMADLTAYVYDAKLLLGQLIIPRIYYSKAYAGTAPVHCPGLISKVPYGAKDFGFLYSFPVGEYLLETGEKMASVKDDLQTKCILQALRRG